MTEQWQSMPNYERYLVSDQGRVMNSKSGHILKPRPAGGTSYLQVGLWKNGARCIFSVHRLVLACFAGPCPEGHECDHIDRNRHNNAISNLRYVTHIKNSRNRKRRPNLSGLRGVYKHGNNWQARLKHNGKFVLNRTVQSKREAALIYIGALAEIDAEDAANAQAEFDCYESDDEASSDNAEDLSGAM